MIAKTINFIPSEMAVPAKSVKLAKVLNKMSIVGVILLILTTVLAIFFFVLFSIELKKVDSSIIALKNEVSSLEKTEQKLILVKDKLGKISYVQSLDSAENEIIEFQKLNDIVNSASDSSLTEINIDLNKTEVSLTSANSDSLSSVLGLFSTIKDYGKIILTSLGLNQTSGFLSSLIFESKK